jgi:carboxyl-terminal processing protease
VLYRIKTDNSESKIKATKNDSMNMPVVILINQNTASAAEIVASCFSENYENVTLVGKTTYGKGTVQKTVKLSTGASIKYTSDKWLTSKGKWLDHDKGVGVKPDVIVDYGDNGNGDKQFAKAQEILNKK